MNVDPKPVLDADDPRVRDYTGLTDMDLRLRHELASGVFMAEGLLIIERAIACGSDVLSVLTAPKWLERLSPILEGSAVPVYVAEDDVMRAITGYSVHRGALSVVRRPVQPSVEEVLQSGGDVLVLEGLVDPTNVGLAIRSAVSQGIDRVILSPDCADPLYRRSVKSSMGAVLRCRWGRSEDWGGTLRQLRSDRAVIALTPGGEQTLEEACAARAEVPVALALGSEGPGLSPDALHIATCHARIPMASDGDSLNVAAAAAVACYVRSRTRTMQA